MIYTPKPHQRYCLNRLLTTNEVRSAGLLLDMGLGKTSITLTAADTLIWDEMAVNKVLVIAPLRVAEDTWTTEAEKWDHLSRLRVVPVLGSRKKRLAALQEDADVYVINRENVAWLCDPKQSGVKRWPFDLVIIDELSSFKSADSKRWRALKRRLPPDVPVWGLTGTIAPKGYIDLWPQIFLLDRGARLGTTLGAYRAKYFTPGARKGHVVYEWKLRPGAREVIDAKLADLCISMRKEDWIHLPPILPNPIEVRMSPAERKEYDRLKKDRVLVQVLGKDLDDAIVGDTAATLSNKLLQMAGGAVYDESGGVVRIHDRKLDALSELVEAAQGQPLLVFYAYKHEAARITERFPDAQLLGPGCDTREMIQRWNSGQIPMLLCHPASAGHGLNLQTGGHIIVWFGLPWSLEFYQQANARLHRMGQTETVIVHHIICAGTLDERVMDVLSNRAAEQNALLDALKAYIKEETDL